MSFKPPRRPQFFYTTAPLPCPYVPGRTERKVVTEITGAEAESLHDKLSRAGFRRSHNIAYAPVCPGCNACVPIRIPVAAFQPDRTLRRIAGDGSSLFPLLRLGWPRAVHRDSAGCDDTAKRSSHPRASRVYTSSVTSGGLKRFQ